MSLPQRLTTTTWPVTLLAGMVALALTACGPSGKAATSAPTPTPPASAAASSAQAPSCDITAAACDAPGESPVTHFTANGFSPAWQAEADRDTLTLLLPDFGGPDVQAHTLKVEHTATAKGADYVGNDGGSAITLSIASGPCDISTEGGQPREFHATLRYGQQTYQGCADAVR